MITLHLVVEPKMMPIPEDVKVIENYGDIRVVSGALSIDGEHMVVRGTEGSIKDWLRPFDGVWFGKGSPVWQEFEVGHIK